MTTLKPSSKLALFLCLSACPFLSRGANVTFGGSFTADNDVQLFSVSLNAPAAIDFRTYGYGGGITSTGTVVASGGFDTVLTLFSSSGTFIDFNDDSASAAVDPTTGMAGDSRITANLAAGSYVLALTQFDNFSSGDLADGFVHAGEPNFTADAAFSSGGPCPGNMFRDISSTAGRCRNGNWTVDFANVTSVTPVAAIPEPSALLLASVGLGLLLVFRLRSWKKIAILAVALVATLGAVQAQQNCPSVQSGPDYCHVSDFLNGQRTLLKVTDLQAVRVDYDVNSFTTTTTLVQIGTSNSQQTVLNNSTTTTSNLNVFLRSLSAHMFEQQGAVTLTTARQGNGFAISVQNAPGIGLLQPLGDQPAGTSGGAVADFNQDGYDDVVFSLNVGSGGGLLFLTANDPTNTSKGLKATLVNFPSVLSIAAGDFNGDGKAEIAAATVSASTGGVIITPYTVDTSTFAISPGPATPLALPGGINYINPINLVSLARGRFNTNTHDQLAVAQVTDVTQDTDDGLRPHVQVVDFDKNLNGSQGPQYIPTVPGVYVEPGFFEIKTGKFGLGGTPGSPFDQIVYHNSSPQTVADSRFFQILTVDPGTLTLAGKGPVIYDQYPCSAGIEVGNFDHQQPDPTTAGQTEHNPNDQVAFLYCSTPSNGSISFIMNIYSANPNTFDLLSNTPDSALDLGSYLAQPTSGNFTPITLVATDIQGRSLVLGEPTKISIDSTIVPNAIVGAPPMHIDFISPAPLSGAPAELFNLSVIPDSFNTTYEQDNSSGTTTSTKNKTSWSFGAKESISGSLTVGDPDEEGIKVSDTLTAAQNLKSESEAAYGTSLASTFGLTTNTGLGDQVVYTDSQFNIWVYPVIGRTVCPAGNPGCTATEKVPLTIQFSAPDGSAKAIISPGADLSWYQPPWEPGNIFSYPANAAQLQAIFPNLTSLTKPVQFATTTGGVSGQATWSGQSQNSSTASFDQDYSFDNDFSVTGAAGFAGISGGFSYGLDISGSYGLSTLSQTTNQVASSTGLKIQIPGTVSDPSKYGYLVSPSIMGTTVGPNVVDSPPDTSSTTFVQTYGRLYAMYTVDPLSSSLGAGPWWKQAYTAGPDVALNHPRRWTSTGTSITGPIPTNCLLIGGSAGAGQYDCVTLNTATPQDPLGDDFHIMRGFFIAKNNVNLPENAASQNKGPQLEYARAGDDLFLSTRIYNYSLADMSPSTQVHASFYYMLWNTQNAAPVDPDGASTFIGEAMTTGPIPKFDTGSSSPLNWTVLGLEFNTADAVHFKDIQGGDVALVFWVVVWAQDDNGFVADLPNHGLPGIPTTFGSWVEATNFECGSAANCYSNNLGVYPEVLFLGGSAGSVPPNPPSPTPSPAPASVNIGKVDLSTSQAALTQKVRVSATVSAQDADAGTMSVNFYDGDPHGAGQLFEVQRIAHIKQDSGYRVAASFRPNTCGTHQLFAVIYQGKPTEVVRRAPPLRVACSNSF